MSWDPFGHLVADLAVRLRACVGAEPDWAAVIEAARGVEYLQAVCGVDDEDRIGRSTLYRRALAEAYRRADLGEAQAAVEATVVRRLVPGLSGSIEGYD